MAVLVHSSDLHIDDDLVKRNDSGLASLRMVLTAARVLSADMVLLAGDTFDNHRVSTAVLHEATALMADAGMPVVLLPGNHDPALPTCLFRRAGLTELPHVHILGVTHADTILFQPHGLEIRGRAHRSFDDMPPLHPPRPRITRWQVVMAHGHYVPPSEWHRESHRAWRISDDDLTATGADYVALGHWDRAATVGTGVVPACYSGSPDLARTINVIRLHETVSVTREPLVFE